MKGFSLSTTRTSGVPEGIHRFVVEDVELKEGPNGIYMNLTCIVDEGSSFDGGKVWLNLSLSEQAKWKLDEFLDALEIEEGLEIDDPEYFIGFAFRGNVEKQEGRNGKMQANIVNFLVDEPVKKAPPKPVAKSKKAAPPPPEEEEDDDQDSEDDEDQDSSEEDDSEEEEQAPVRKPPAKAAVKKPAGKMPQDIKGKTSKFKRPF